MKGPTARRVVQAEPMEIDEPDRSVEMFLYEIAVHPDHRRRGIGTALVDHLAAVAREHSCYDMWVITNLDNTAAVATYRAAGGTAGSGEVVSDWRP